MGKKTISIIIPIYNAENYIDRCLGSIVNQTYKDLEIICINDGSSDKSKNILRKWEKSDKRIKVYDLHNGGVSKARNFALDVANGMYIMFVDIDDWISKNTCELALNQMLIHSVDVVMWPYLREFNSKKIPKKIFDQDIIFERDSILILHRKLFGLLSTEMSNPENADALCTVWGKLYTKEIIDKNGIRFYDIKKIGSYEDGLFNIDYLKKANKAFYMNNYLYHYWKENGSSITSNYNADLFQQKKNLYKILESKIANDCLDSSYLEALNNRKCLDYVSLGINATSDKSSIMTQVKRLRNILDDQERQILIKSFDTRNMPFYWKTFYFLLKKKSTLGYFGILKIIQFLRK